MNVTYVEAITPPLNTLEDSLRMGVAGKQVVARNQMVHLPLLKDRALLEFRYWSNGWLETH